MELLENSALSRKKRAQKPKNKVFKKVNMPKSASNERERERERKKEREVPRPNTHKHHLFRHTCQAEFAVPLNFRPTHKAQAPPRSKALRYDDIKRLQNSLNLQHLLSKARPFLNSLKLIFEF